MLKSLDKLGPGSLKVIQALTGELSSLAEHGHKRLTGKDGAINKYNYIRIIEELASIDCSERTKEDIDKLKKATKDLKWFAQLNSQKVYKNKNVHDKICKHLKLQTIKANETVFSRNDFADKFYLLLQGALICYGPRSETYIKRDRNALKYI